MKQKDAFIIGGDFNVKIVIGVGDGKSTHIQKICQNKVNNENGNFLLNINFILYSLPMRFLNTNPVTKQVIKPSYLCYFSK